MATIQQAPQVLDRHYLELRCGLLDLAATLDRIERSDDSQRASGDPRLAKIQEALKIVASSGADRAERIQLLFSDEYSPGWNRSK